MSDARTLHERAVLLALSVRGLHACLVAHDPLDEADMLPLVNASAELANALRPPEPT